MVSTSAREDPWVPWIYGIAAGDSDALTGLYDASGSLVFGIALRMLEDPADAEEVALDVYKYVWKCPGTYDVTRGAVAAWLIMLVRSRCLDRIRSRDHRERAEQPVRQASSVAAPDPIATGQTRAVQQALASLPPEQAELIELTYFAGFSHVELAQRTGLPLGTVKTRLRLGLSRLRDLLDDWQP